MVWIQDLVVPHLDGIHILSSLAHDDPRRVFWFSLLCLCFFVVAAFDDKNCDTFAKGAKGQKRGAKQPKYRMEIRVR